MKTKAPALSAIATSRRDVLHCNCTCVFPAAPSADGPGDCLFFNALQQRRRASPCHDFATYDVDSGHRGGGRKNLRQVKMSVPAKSFSLRRERIDRGDDFSVDLTRQTWSTTFMGFLHP